MGARDNRVFRYAVLLSVLVHAVALFVSPSLRDAARRVVWPEPIVARLAEPERPPSPAPAEPQVPAPLVEPPPQPKPPPVARAAPKPLPAPVPAPAEPAPRAAEPPPPAPAASQSAPPPAAAAPAPAAPVARAGAEIDADTVGRYRMLVIDEARKLKRYPRAARDNNWEGRARVRVSYGADGRRASVAVVRSSGFEVLDRETVETVTRAAEVPVPAGLRGKAFAFEIEMEFNLTEQ